MCCACMQDMRLVVSLGVQLCGCAFRLTALVLGLARAEGTWRVAAYRKGLQQV